RSFGHSIAPGDAFEVNLGRLPRAVAGGQRLLTQAFDASDCLVGSVEQTVSVTIGAITSASVALAAVSRDCSVKPPGGEPMPDAAAGVDASGVGGNGGA